VIKIQFSQAERNTQLNIEPEEFKARDFNAEDRTKNNSVKRPQKKKSVGRELLGWLVYIVVVGALAWLIVTFVGTRTKVIGSSMNDTLQDNNQLIVDKISYRFSDPKRFDIVIFPYKFEDDTYFIKRVIGLPGETVQVKEDGCVYINGKKLESDIYGKEPMQSAGLAKDPIKLGDNDYFVLGDNRNNSKDSRFDDVGILTKKDLVGRAFIRIYPFSEFGLIKHQ
jgi:signal peptidase I